MLHVLYYGNRGNVMQEIGRNGIVRWFDPIYICRGCWPVQSFNRDGVCWILFSLCSQWARKFLKQFYIPDIARIYLIHSHSCWVIWGAMLPWLVTNWWFCSHVWQGQTSFTTFACATTELYYAKPCNQCFQWQSGTGACHTSHTMSHVHKWCLDTASLEAH